MYLKQLFQKNIWETIRQKGRDKRDVLVLALIFFLGGWLYKNALAVPFIFDDYLRIVDNPFIKHLSFAVLWQHNPFDFITNLTFAVSYRLGGLHVLGWHLFNIALHLVNSFLVYCLLVLIQKTPHLRRLLPSGDQFLLALGCALLFLVHPVQTQAVVYIVQRSTLLFSCFYLSGLIAYLRFRIDGKRHSVWWAVLWAALGTFTKPSFLTFPLVIFLLETMFFEREEKPDLKRSFFFGILCLPIILIPLGAVLTGSLHQQLQAALSLGGIQDHVLTQVRVSLEYWRLLILPFEQNLDYDYVMVRKFTDVSFLIGCSIMGMILLGAYKLFSVKRIFSFSALWFFVTIAPTWIPLPDLFYEHWLYLPSVGFSLALMYVLYLVLQKTTWRIAVAVIIIAMAAQMTLLRVQVWQDPVAFMQDVIRQSPMKPRPYNNLGSMLLEKGERERAEAYFRKSLEVDPRYHLAATNLALLSQQRGDSEEAVRQLEKILQKFPGNMEARLHLAQNYLESDRSDEAVEQLQIIDKKIPFSAPFHVTLGNYYQRLFDWDRAQKEYETAIWLNPDSAIAWYNLGNLYYRNGNLYQAMLNYKKTLELDSQIPEALNNLGHIYYYFNDYDNAVEIFRKSITAESGSPDAYYNLANALYARGDTEESREMAVKAMKLYEQTGNIQKADSLKEKIGLLDP